MAPQNFLPDLFQNHRLQILHVAIEPMGCPKHYLFVIDFFSHITGVVFKDIPVLRKYAFRWHESVYVCISLINSSIISNSHPNTWCNDDSWVSWSPINILTMAPKYQVPKRAVTPTNCDTHPHRCCAKGHNPRSWSKPTDMALAYHPLTSSVSPPGPPEDLPNPPKGVFFLPG